MGAQPLLSDDRLMTSVVAWARMALVAAALSWAGWAQAGEEGSRSFGLVDLSVAAERAPEGLRREIESWAKGRGLQRIGDAGMLRALNGPEAAGPVVARLVS